MIGVAAWAAMLIGTPAGPESLSLEADYWGKPLAKWTVAPSGDGRLTVSKEVPGGKFGDYDLVTVSFRVSPEEYGQIEALLAPARRFAGHDLPCKLLYTDGVYGTVAWSSSETLAFNLGCSSEEVAPLLAGFGKAAALVERLAKSGKTIETKQVRASGAPAAAGSSR